jgi:hypothetical protein
MQPFSIVTYFSDNTKKHKIMEGKIPKKLKNFGKGIEPKKETKTNIHK